MKKHLFQLFQMKEKKRDRSFYTVLFLSLFIVSITSTLLLTISLAINFLSSISSSSKNYNKQLLAQTNYTIDQIKENANWLSNSLLSDENVFAYLSLTSTNNSTVPVLASREIYKHLMVLPYVDSIYLYNADLDLIYSSKTGYQQPLDSFADKKTMSRLQDKNFIENYQGTPVPTGNVLTYFLFDTHMTTDAKDAIIINFKSSTLTDSIVSMKDLSNNTHSNFLLLDSDMNYLVSVLDNNISKDSEWLDSALKSLSKKEALKSSYVKVNGRQYFLTHTDKNVYGWNLFNLTPAKILFQDIITTILISFFIWIGGFIFILFLCRLFAKRLNEPVENFTKQLLEVHSGSNKRTEFRTKEFNTILSTVSSLQQNNKQLRSVQQKSRYSLTQSCLNSFVANRQSILASYDSQKLEHLNIRYLETDKLCMAIFKIDHYRTFLTKHTGDELWAIQFSVVNIMEELTSAQFKCNALSRNDDKFVLFISCASETDLVAFEDKLVLLLQEIQKAIETYLHFTMTVSYSNVFHGLEKLPITYENTKRSLLLKMRYGHSAVIDPYMIDEVQTEPFQVSYKLNAQLLEQMTTGDFKKSWSTYEKLTQNLFYCDYDEITATMIHLIHNIYEQLSEKYPMLKDVFTEALKVVVAKLTQAEVSEDIQSLSYTFIETLCSAVQKLKEDPAQQNSTLIAEKIAQMIEEQYPDSSLCLASIAETIGLSANYTGQIFKQHTQKSVSQYLLEVRMEKIAFYLQTTSLPISKILEKVGMEMNNYFYTRFKNYFGMSLSDYKQKYISETPEQE